MNNRKHTCVAAREGIKIAKIKVVRLNEANRMKAICTPPPPRRRINASIMGTRQPRFLEIQSKPKAINPLEWKVYKKINEK